MTRTAILGHCVSPEVRESDTVLVPVGSLEQHGPHLPLDTDTRIAVAVARGARDRLADPDVLVAPELAYGASGEHEGFGGTISLGHDALRQVLIEFGRSASRWARRVLFVNGHGGNAHTVAGAVATLRYEGRDAAWFPCAFTDADAHAGDTETSILLHLSPDLVRWDRVEAGNREPVAALMPAMRSAGVAAVSANGVLGDPRGADAGRGAALVDGAVTGLADAVRRWVTDEGGLLR